jgi:hypothetical protein
MEKQKWFEIVALSNKGEAEVHDVEGNQIFIRGGFENVVLIQVPNAMAVDHQATQHVMRSIEALLGRAGITKDVMVVPDTLEFCRLNPLNEAMSAVLEEKFHQKQVARIRAHEEARKRKLIEVVDK